MEAKQGVSTRIYLDPETNEIVKRFQATYYLETGESITKEKAIIQIIQKMQNNEQDTLEKIV